MTVDEIGLWDISQWNFEQKTIYKLSIVCTVEKKSKTSFQCNAALQRCWPRIRPPVLDFIENVRALRALAVLWSAG